MNCVYTKVIIVDMCGFCIIEELIVYRNYYFWSNFICTAMELLSGLAKPRLQNLLGSGSHKVRETKQIAIILLHSFSRRERTLYFIFIARLFYPQLIKNRAGSDGTNCSVFHLLLFFFYYSLKMK